MYNATIQKLRETFGENVSLSKAVRETHGQDESSHSPSLPDAVFFAESTADVAKAVKIAASGKMPIIPFGAGTSLEGHIIPTLGGLTIDMSRMNRVLSVNSEDLDARVEAGITRLELNQHLRDQGLFFPVDPGANCTLGGMVATRASGTNAVKYGTMREQLLSLKVVTANGDIIETGSRSRKSSAGYDLTHLFCGSEGTLGIVTEISLKLHGIPEKVSAGVCRFNTINDAINTVIETIQLGIPVSRIELLDNLSIQAVNQYSKTSYPEAPTLFLEFTGTEASVADQIENFRMLASDHSGTQIEFASSHEEVNKIWHARHQLYYATKALAPGFHTLTTDVCVPISKLAECMTKTQADIQQSGLLGSMLGHVGDGNFHTILLIDPDNSDEQTKAEALNKIIVERAIQFGGTCTGEHGIGLGKKEYLSQEKPSALPLMKIIKQALDPDNILNPGKIL